MDDIEGLTFPMEEDVYEGIGGAVSDPYIVMSENMQNAEWVKHVNSLEATSPVILIKKQVIPLGSQPINQTLDSLKKFMETTKTPVNNILAINGIAALKLIKNPSDLPNELQPFIYVNGPPYTNITELDPKQVLFICLCHQLVFLYGDEKGIESFNATFPVKFRLARIAVQKSLQNPTDIEHMIKKQSLEKFWAVATKTLAVTDALTTLDTMMNLFLQPPDKIYAAITDNTTSSTDSSASSVAATLSDSENSSSNMSNNTNNDGDNNASTESAFDQHSLISNSGSSQSNAATKPPPTPPPPPTPKPQTRKNMPPPILKTRRTKAANKQNLQNVTRRLNFGSRHARQPWTRQNRVQTRSQSRLKFNESTRNTLPSQRKRRSIPLRTYNDGSISPTEFENYTRRKKASSVRSGTPKNQQEAEQLAKQVFNRSLIPEENAREQAKADETFLETHGPVAYAKRQAQRAEWNAMGRVTRSKTKARNILFRNTANAERQAREQTRRQIAQQAQKNMLARGQRAAQEFTK